MSADRVADEPTATVSTPVTRECAVRYVNWSSPACSYALETEPNHEDGVALRIVEINKTTGRKRQIAAGVPMESALEITKAMLEVTKTIVPVDELIESVQARLAEPAFRGEIIAADFEPEDHIEVIVRAPKDTRVGHWNVEVRRA